jgi:hypothetical protein
VRMAIHAVVDNYATHKHPKVQKWLARHPRWTFVPRWSARSSA